MPAGARAWAGVTSGRCRAAPSARAIRSIARSSVVHSKRSNRRRSSAPEYDRSVFGGNPPVPSGTPPAVIPGGNGRSGTGAPPSGKTPHSTREPRCRARPRSAISRPGAPDGAEGMANGRGVSRDFGATPLRRRSCSPLPRLVSSPRMTTEHPGDKAGVRARGAVLASDAFFPFRDGVDVAAAAGVTAIVHPGGSVRDAEVVAAADEHAMAMVLTGERHFRH